MEKITDTISRPRPRSSETAGITKPDQIKLQRLGEVIDRWRLNLGWRPLDPDSLYLAAQSWLAVLDAESVPAEVYNELFNRALRLRASAISAGRNVPDFGVELLIACWTGEHGLQRELAEKRIQEGRTLTANAESVCMLCFGSGFKEIEKHSTRGVIRCDHIGGD